MGISTFEFGQHVVEADGGGRRLGGILSASQQLKLPGEVQQPRHAAQARNRVRMTRLPPVQSGASSRQPEIQTRQFAFHHAPATRRGQRRQIVGGMGKVGFSTINSGQGRLPNGAPPALFEAGRRRAIHHGRIKKSRREPGQPPMGTDGMTKGGERLRPIIRATPTAPQPRAIQAARQTPRGGPRGFTNGGVEGHHLKTTTHPGPDNGRRSSDRPTIQDGNFTIFYHKFTKF